MATRLQLFTEQLLKTLSDISHRLNIYTGTDYTPVDDLRADITTQEAKVKESRYTVHEAKEAHLQAGTTQATSHKEVVQLLERKHSWSAQDLERYMSLIRSEHVNEQAVTEAKERLMNEERQLEESRQGLEKMERRMYHLEQIWSDTIRRNSTWITFALMGLNLVLLIGNFAIFEPWRRRRIVREIRAAIDEKSVTTVTAPSPVTHDGVFSNEPLDQPIPGPPEGYAEAVSPLTDATSDNDIQSSPTTLATSAPEMVTGSLTESMPIKSSTGSDGSTYPFSSATSLVSRAAWTSTFERLRLQITDLASRRDVVLRKVDLTSAILEGVAAGTVGTLAVIWLLGGITRR